MESSEEDVDLCWARLAEDDSLDETACNKPSIDQLGLCAQHRRSVTKPIKREVNG